MPFPQMLALIVFLFPLAYSPGPGNMFFAALGANSGLIASLPANAGYHLATFVVTLSIGLGFSFVTSNAGHLMAALQGVGALYIIWLAFKIWRSDTKPQAVGRRKAGFSQGALLLLLNPKGYMIIALMFSQFTTETPGQTAMITAIFTLNNMFAFLVWTLAGQSLTRAFQSPKATRIINTGFAGFLVITALLMLLT